MLVSVESHNTVPQDIGFYINDIWSPLVKPTLLTALSAVHHSPEDEQSILFEKSRPQRLFSEPTHLTWLLPTTCKASNITYSYNLSQLPGDRVYSPTVALQRLFFKHNINLYPHRYPFILMGKEKQCTVKCLAQGHKYHMVTARIQIHILGHLLFLMYINKLHTSSSFLSFLLFADDTTITCSKSSCDSLVHTLNSELIKVASWFKSNKLFLNPNKTKCMLFNKSNPPPSLLLTISLFAWCILLNF